MESNYNSNSIRDAQDWPGAHAPAAYPQMAARLYQQYQASKSKGDIDQAIEYLRRSIQSENGSVAGLPTRYIKLAQYLRVRFLSFSDDSDLSEGLLSIRHAYHLVVNPSPERRDCLILETFFLSEQYRRTRMPADLLLAIQAGKDYLTYTSNTKQNNIVIVSSIAQWYRVLYDTTKQRQYLFHAVSFMRRALAEASHEAPVQSANLWQFAQWLEDSFQISGKIEDLEVAINCGNKVLRVTPREHNGRPEMLDAIARRQALLYERTQDSDTLDIAIKLGRDALECAPNFDGKIIKYLNNLAVRLEKRHDLQGNSGDLDEAISLSQIALLALADNSPYMLESKEGLALRLHSRFMRDNRREDLDRAIQLLRQAHCGTKPSSPHFPMRSSHLGSLLRVKYEQYDNINDLSDAVELLTKAVDLTPKESPDLPLVCGNLCRCLSARYSAFRNDTDINSAFATATLGLESATKNGQYVAAASQDYAQALLDRFDRFGKVDDLEETIKIIQQAISATPKDAVELVERLDIFADACHSRYVQHGRVVDLDQAVEISRQALAATGRDNAGRSGRLSNLSTMLGDLYIRTWETSALNEAIQCASEALEATEKDDAGYGIYSNALGVQLFTKYRLTADTQFLQKCIERHRCALSYEEAPSTDWALYSSCLSKALAELFSESHNLSYLEEAIGKMQNVITSMPADDARLCANVGTLASLFERKFLYTKLAEDCSSCVDTYLRAWECRDSSAYDRIWAAARCIPYLASTGTDGIERGILLGQEILQLVPSIFCADLSYTDQQHATESVLGVASNLCSMLLKVHRIDDALYFLECGRTIMIKELISDDDTEISISDDYDTEIVISDDGYSSASQSPLSVARAMETTETTATSLLDDAFMEDAQLEDAQRSTLSSRNTLQNQLDYIFSTGTTQKYIILVNISQIKSHAILLSGAGSPVAVDLPDITHLEAKQWVNKNWEISRLSQFKNTNKNMLEYLEWIKRVCIQPIFSTIFATGQPGHDYLPRIWWIGTGLASSMPFHAACMHNNPPHTDEVQEVVSSYMPSIGVLAYLLKKDAKQQQLRALHVGNDSILLAAMPTTPSLKIGGKPPEPLPMSTVELERITQHASNVALDALKMIQPSVNDVLSTLSDCTMAHFACHGISSAFDPTDSCLILQKTNSADSGPEQDRLTIDQIFRLKVQKTNIVYLSACSTARNKVTELCDENVHVATALQVAGVPHVIACLWRSMETACVEIAEEFYRLIFEMIQLNNSDELDVAMALHKATSALRAKNELYPLEWATFAHFGV